MRSKRGSLVYKISLLIMVISLLGVGTLAYLSYSDTKEIFLQSSAKRLEQKAKDYINFLENRLENLEENIMVLASNPLIEGMFRAYNNPYRYDSITNKTFLQFQNDVVTMLRLLLLQNKTYFQVRLIDLEGQEIVKLIKKNGQVTLIEAKNLQNKAHRGYFKEIRELAPGGVYYSKIDLNREFHTIEFPLTPTLRVGKLIRHDNKNLGILIINVDVKKLLRLDRFLHDPDTLTFIANQEGYYIFNEVDPNKEFGFEFGKEFVITKDFAFLQPLYKDKKQLESIRDENIFNALRFELPNGRFLVILHQATPRSFLERAQHYIHKLLLYILLITFGITLLTILLVRWFTKPILKLTAIAQEIAKTKGEKSLPIEVHTNDEIEELAKTLKIMLDRLVASKEEIASFAQKLEEEVEKKTAELKELNENLQKMVDEKVEEIRQKDRALMQQSKLAQMGEMIGAIAHQWRQPLNSLALYVQNLADLAENGELDQKRLEEFEQKSMETIEYMSKTIDDFRNFFRKDKEKTRFNIKEVVQETIHLQAAQLQNRGIEVRTKLEDVVVEGYRSEFMQVLLNLIANARDAIEEHNKDGGIIEIEVTKEKDEAVVKIKDNAGGIPPTVIERIFEPYFTTKEDKKGTGLGLYMSKDIIERMGGKIEVKNGEGGAEFTIRLKAYNASAT